MSSFTLKAVERNKFGTSESKKIRRSGMIPAIIYSDEKNINFSVPRKEFEINYFEGNIYSSIAEIELNNKKIKAIAHIIDLDPVSDKPIHIDFIECKESNIRAQIKVNFINQDKCPGLKQGGLLHINVRKLPILCEDEAQLIHKIDIDTVSMKIDDKIRVLDVKLPSGIKHNKNPDFLIASITGRSSKEEEGEGVTEEVSDATTKPKASNV